MMKQDKEAQHQEPHVWLRALEPEDLEVLYQVENDREVWDVGLTNVPYSRYVLRDFIAHSSGDIYTDRQVRLMVENDEGETVGIVDLLNFDPAHRRAEIGVVIRKERRRQGVATAALKELLDYARKTLHLHQVYAFVSKDNEASSRLFLKLGFEENGLLREWLFDGFDYHDAALLQFFFKKTS